MIKKNIRKKLKIGGVFASPLRSSQRRAARNELSYLYGD